LPSDGLKKPLPEPIKEVLAPEASAATATA